MCSVCDGDGGWRGGGGGEKGRWFRGNGGGSVRRAADGGKGARVGGKEERPSLGQPCSRFLSVAQTPRTDSRVPSAVSVEAFRGSRRVFGEGGRRRVEDEPNVTTASRSPSPTRATIIFRIGPRLGDIPRLGEDCTYTTVPRSPWRTPCSPPPRCRVTQANIMRELNHPNVVSIYDFYQDDPDYFYMVLEFMEGGELFGRIVKKVSCNLIWYVAVPVLSA